MPPCVCRSAIPGFEAQTGQTCSRWFWGPNHQTIHPGFWGLIWRTLMHTLIWGTHRCRCVPNLHVLGPAVHQALATPHRDFAQPHPWLQWTPSSSPTYYFSLMCLMRAAHGLTLASWSFGTSLYVRPSPLLIHHHARTSRLTFSIACWPPQHTQHLHIHKPSDMLQNTLKITKKTWHLWLAIDIIKHKWHMNSTGKASNLSTLVSIIHHTWMRPRHFSSWSLKNSALMNALNYTETHQRRFESKTENSHSSTQKSSKSKYKVTWYEKGSWKIQVKKVSVPKERAKVKHNQRVK